VQSNSELRKSTLLGTKNVKIVLAHNFAKTDRFTSNKNHFVSKMPLFICFSPFVVIMVRLRIGLYSLSDQFSGKMANAKVNQDQGR